MSPVSLPSPLPLLSSPSLFAVLRWQLYGEAMLTPRRLIFRSTVPGQTGADDEEYEVIPDDELHHDDDQRATAHDHADEDDVEGHV